MLRELGDALLSKGHALFAFEVERLGHDRNGQNAQVFGHFRHHWRCAGAGAAAHTGSDKDHVCSLQRRTQSFAIFFRRGTTNFRIRSGTQTFGDIGADLDSLANRCFTQRLSVGVHSEEFHTFDTLAYHVLYGVAAAPADADDFNHRVIG